MTGNPPPPAVGLQSLRFVPLLLVFLIALTLRASYLLTLEIDTPIRGDALKYMTIAYNLVERGVYSRQPGPDSTADSFITPGYPLFLAAIYRVTGSVNTTYHAALWIHVLLGSLVAAMSCCIARRFVSNVAAYTAGTLIALSPVLTVIGGFLLTETLFSFVLVCSVLAMLRALQAGSPAGALAAGMLFGVGALVRPVILLFPAAFAVLTLVAYSRSSGMRRLALPLVLGSALAWSPWLAWSTLETATRGSNARDAIAFGMYPDFTHKDPALRGYPHRDDPDFSRTSQSYSSILEKLLQHARDEPARYLYWYMVGKPLAFWSGDDPSGIGGPFVYNVKATLYHKQFPVHIYELSFRAQPLLLLLGAIGVACAGLRLRHRQLVFAEAPAALLLVSCLVVYVTLLHMVTSALPRYGFPFFPFLYMIATYAFCCLLRGASVCVAHVQCRVNRSP